jgi:preprotein translocase subunit SecG
MITFLMVLFVILCLFLALFVLLQQGKGDMGLGGLGGGGQVLFGGSGGQEFFERVTWIMVALFLLGSLGLTILKSQAMRTSRVEGYRANQTTRQAAPPPVKLPVKK